VLRGTLDLLILKTLARSLQNGYGITVHVERVSDEVLRVEERVVISGVAPGSSRRAGSAPSGARLRTTARAKYYRLTPVGR
jgi:PadR family transcriptional regulator PadR